MPAPLPMIIYQSPAKAVRLKRLPINAQQFDEAWLQDLLFRYPELLAADEVDPAYDHLIPLAREFPCRSGFIDILYATPSGLLCLVETKLWRNAEAHRTVLAQVLDYAKDLSRLPFSDLASTVQKLVPSSGTLFDVCSRGLPKGSFDSLNFENNLRRSLSTGNFLILIVGDRIRPEVALLSEIVGTAAQLEFSLGLVEMAFHRMDEKQDWPLLCVPQVVGKTHEVTRAVIKIRYEEKAPEVTVETTEQSPTQRRTDEVTFLASLPTDVAELYRPYLQKWNVPPLCLSWGKGGVTVKYLRPGKNPLAIVGAGADWLYPFKEYYLGIWEKAEEAIHPAESTPPGPRVADAYRAYRQSVMAIPTIQTLFSTGYTNVYYKNTPIDDLRALIGATDKLIEDLVALKLT